jgi:hypothetical protein
VVLAGTMLAACSQPTETDPAADELSAKLQAELDVAATTNAATAASVAPIKPTFKCVDKLSPTSYRAHFGYTNSSSSSIANPVGFYNRFFPDPQGRGQPTTFLAGPHPDIIQVTFSSSSLLAWVLGSGVAVATRSSSLCPTGTGGATGSGGSVGTGGRAGTGGGSGVGGRTGTGGVVGAGGRTGAGGAGQCPSTCDDHNPCTTDLCSASTGFQCTNVAARDGTVCDDGNACTVSDQCVAGACTPGVAKVCQPLDQCHVAGVCNTTTGLCTSPNIADGTACSDGNACTLSDKCAAGVCTAGSPKVCQTLDQCHVAGTCNPTSGVCSNPNVADGTACTDNNLCTAVDACQAGSCVGLSPKACTASDQCHVVGTCAPSTGLCSNPAAGDGTPCNDGNKCTIGDACQAGTCTPAQTLTASHCAGPACEQCSFDVGNDICSVSPDWCANCFPETDGCDLLADPTDRQLCEDVYGCYTDPAKNCVAQGSVLACWCGTNPTTCNTDNTDPTKANGPCLDFITRAARLTPATYDAATVEQRLVDPDFPLGRATNLVTCRGTYCSAECSVP